MRQAAPNNFPLSMLRSGHRLRRNTSLPARRLRFETLEERLPLSGTGLTAQYFHNEDFTGLAATRLDAIGHNWGTAAPVAGVDSESFSVRWTGQVEADFSETYTFYMTSDEGARLWVDGRLLVDDWTPHLRHTRSGTIQLEAGHKYDIRVDYFEQSGPAQIELFWSSASQTNVTVPEDHLYESPAGLLGTYADEIGNRFTRIDQEVDFDWGLSSPGAGVAADDFHVTWSGQIRADFSDQYVFSTLSDDGARLWIAGELVVDGWSSGGTVAEHQGAKSLEAGKWYDVRLEYFEHDQAAEVHLRWSSDRQTGPGIFATVPPSHLRAAQATPVTFTDPLGPGADPFVVHWQDEYYLVRSQGNGVWINRAESLTAIHSDHPDSETLQVWAPPSGTSYSEQIWAPELHYISGRWYIYVAASDGDNSTHRMHVLERDSADPFGPFTYKGVIAAATDRWAIDGTAFEWNGKWYFVWSGWPGFQDGQQNLYIAEMRNPWTLRGDRVLISTPQYDWEQHGLAINEGPEVLVHDGQLHIVYSASGFWTPEYALGRLTFSGVGTPLDPSSWIKHPVPVFEANTEVVGTGHASFVTSPDGNEHWIVYHAHANPNQFNDDRVISIQPFAFNADGAPNFGTPVSPGTPIPVPSIGPEPERVFVTGDYNADGAVDDVDYLTWRLTFGQLVFPGSAADGSGNGVVDAPDYTIWRDRFGGQVAGGAGTHAPFPLEETRNASLGTTVAVSETPISAGDFDGEVPASAGAAVAAAGNPIAWQRAVDRAFAKSFSVAQALEQRDIALPLLATAIEPPPLRRVSPASMLTDACERRADEAASSGLLVEELGLRADFARRMVIDAAPWRRGEMWTE